MKKIVLLLFVVVFCASSAIAQPPKAKADYDSSKEQAALEKIMREHLERMSDKANSTGSGDENNIKGYVLSTQIRTFSGISENIKNEINEMKEQARLLIRTVATDIELTSGTSGVLIMDEKGKIRYKPDPSLPEELNSKRESLLRAQMDNNVSVRSATMAMKLLVEINNSFKERA
ncbi:MAG: hypothetical protein D3908_08595, partial [Candidatus Electrothrix sp. AUS4]|nr:hypothetical protein [Candidatus Electrothrix sp. AUS4]